MLDTQTRQKCKATCAEKIRTPTASPALLPTTLCTCTGNTPVFVKQKMVYTMDRKILVQRRADMPWVWPIFAGQSLETPPNRISLDEVCHCQSFQHREQVTNKLNEKKNASLAFNIATNKWNNEHQWCYPAWQDVIVHLVLRVCAAILYSKRKGLIKNLLTTLSSPISPSATKIWLRQKRTKTTG